MTISTTQELPNRVNSGGGKATVGSTTSADTNDPVTLDHDGDHWYYYSGLPNNGFVFTTPSLPAITDLDVRCQVYLTALTPVDTNQVIKHEDSGTTRSFVLYHASDGTMRTAVSQDGTTWSSFISSSETLSAAGVPLNQWVWLRWTVDTDNGASGKDYAFYYSVDNEASWTQIGFTVTNAGAYSGIYTNAATVNLNVFGHASTTTSPMGIRQVKVMSAIGGTEVLKTDLSSDIDTSTDPDAGQSGWTAETGGAIVVNRASSGLVGTVVTRPTAVFDGTDDYLQLPTEDTPAFTATTGKHTVVVAYRMHVTPAATDRLWSSESTNSDGAWLVVSSASDVAAFVGGSSTTASSTATGTFDDGVLRVAALVIDDGTIATYVRGEGLQSSASTTSVGTVTHGVPRVCSRGHAVTNNPETEIFATLTFKDLALTEDQLDSLATKLINGDYT